MQLTFRYGDEEFDCEVCSLSTVKGKVAIHIHPDGSVQVDAPPGTTTSSIKKAVQKRARWITKHLANIRAQQRELRPRHYVSGEGHFYLGRRYQLKVRQNDTEQPSVKLLRGYLSVSTSEHSSETVKRLLWQWYRSHAQQTFQRRLETLEPQLTWLTGQRPHIKLLTMKKQWGSCSPQGHILLNPHLVKAPRDCIDYVILHELCHLQEHNHSPKFYQLLSQLMPAWKSVKTRLDSMAELLLNT